MGTRSSRWKDVDMPAPHPTEFRDDVVAVARRGEAPVAAIAKDSGPYPRILDTGVRPVISLIAIPKPPKAT